MTMRELLEIGAPSLPDGYFYRVHHGPLRELGRLYVTVRERRGLFSREVAESWCDPTSRDWSDVPPRDVIAQLAESAWRKFHETAKDTLRWREIDAFMGDHE